MPEKISCDVTICGSGAGAGLAAELLAKAGLKVWITEEGLLKSSSNFNQLASLACSARHQESVTRKTSDQAINILQGRCVGGTNTANWTRSLRTPFPALKFRQGRFGLHGCTEAGLAPYFAQADRRLDTLPWHREPNENNVLLVHGVLSLGIHAYTIARKGKACWNLGFRGLGDSATARQPMRVATIPAGLSQCAQLLTETQATHFGRASGQVRTLACQKFKPKRSFPQSLYAHAAIKKVAKRCLLADVAPSTRSRCCCVRARPTPIAGWNAEPFCVRWQCLPASLRRRSVPGAARRMRYGAGLRTPACGY